MKNISQSISGLYSILNVKYSLFAEKTIKSWTLMLPGAGCEYHKLHGGCIMCGFYKSTDKYSRGRLYPGFVFRTMFFLAQRAMDIERPQELIIFNGGNFLNAREIPDDFRRYLYRQVSDSDYLNQLVIESRCEYIVKDKITEAVNALCGKRLVIGIGLESYNDHIRNVIIRKSLSKEIFEEKVSLLTRYGVDVLVYIFLKPLGLSEEEAYQDVIGSIKYALSAGVKEIVLSCAFVQEGTKMAEAFHQGNFQPPYLWTILRIIGEIEANNWPVSIGGFSDEPMPIAIPANCPDCSSQIYSAIENFRRYRILGDIPNCNCRQRQI